MVFAVFVLLLQLSCVLAGGKYDPISNEFLINVDELPSNPRLTLIPEISFEEGYAFLYSNYQ